MKNKFIFAITAAFLMVVGLGLASWDESPKAEETVVKYSDAEGDFQSTGTMVYEHTFTKDTITNANNDTLYLPSRLRPVLSDFIMTVSITRTSISGTANIAAKVEETTYRYSGSKPPTAGWVTSFNNLGAAADTDATTATEEEIRIPNAYGLSYRVIIDGSGTQSTSYVVRVVLKKKS